VDPGRGGEGAEVEASRSLLLKLEAMAIAGWGKVGAAASDKSVSGGSVEGVDGAKGGAGVGEGIFARPPPM
jgi:hypothetical protein